MGQRSGRYSSMHNIAERERVNTNPEQVNPEPAPGCRIVFQNPASKNIGVLLFRIFIFMLIAIFSLLVFQPPILNAGSSLSCLNRIKSTDAFLAADHTGHILQSKNAGIQCIPASTLKILTSLAAIHYLHGTYRFRTEFYIDPDGNLKIKGYGDPLLISEVLRDIAGILAKEVGDIKDIIVDDTWFSPDIIIPGRNLSTNPYDAPVGALCANFNTVFFDRDHLGRIISAEPQTPMIPFALKKIKSLGLKKGRYTFSHEPHDPARYAGELLLYFLKQGGVKAGGIIRAGVVERGDTLIYTYRSCFALEAVLKKMMEFSNNFIANQVFIAMGADVSGPPGTLAKGVRSVSEFARDELRLEDLKIVEGSGISRENRISALDMLKILRRFESYKYLLNRKENFIFKTGTLNGVRTRAGYIEGQGKGPRYFVIFLNRPGADIKSVMKCLKNLEEDN